MSEAESDVALVFHRAHLPPSLYDNQAACVSLQSFESSLILLSVYRPIDALLAIARAIESLLKAEYPEKKYEIFNPQKKKRERLKADFWVLLQKAHEDRDWADLERLREKRNKFTHDAYSTRDDREAALLYFLEGIPYLHNAFRVLWGVDLYRSNISHELARYLKYTVEVVESHAEADGFDAHDAAGLVSAKIRHVISPTFSGYLQQLADDGEDLFFDDLRKLFDSLKYRFNGYNEDPLCCPVCEELWLITDLDLPDETIQNPFDEPLGIIGCRCVSCGFGFRDQSAPGLLTTLLGEQVEAIKAELLVDYGYKP